MTPLLDELRERATRDGLRPRDAPNHPVEQFRAWFEQAKTAGVAQPRAMTLATVNAQGRPTARMVVLAGFDDGGFDFTTDARSPKMDDLRPRPWAALVFYWADLERQVRIEGQVEPLPDAAADVYFHLRSRGSQLATWVARQSDVIAGRAALEERLLQLLAEHEHAPISRPPYYLGYRLVPALLEFWQGRSDLLNDRLRYTRSAAGSWQIERLAP